MQKAFILRAALAIAFGLALGAASCGRKAPTGNEGNIAAASAPLRPGEFGRAVEPGRPAHNIETFDTLDFDVFSNQKWDRLKESHADDIIVSWLDGHETRGIETHIADLKKLFVHAPDTAIKVHSIRVAEGDWTAVTGAMTGTSTRPMPLPDGSLIQPTGKKFSLRMATFGHWKNGRMDHEWLYWDNAAYIFQLGIGK
jgi:predicted ester cyclase